MGAISAVKCRKGFNAIPLLKKMIEAQIHRGNENLSIATDNNFLFVKHLDGLNQIQSTDAAIAHNDFNVESNDAPQLIQSQSRSIIIESDYLGFSESFDQLIKILSAESPEKSLTKLVSKVDGQYEIVILHKGNIFAARDPVGLKPLYYGRDTNFIAVSTEKKGLWNLGIKKINIFLPGHVWQLEQDTRPSCVRQIAKHKLISDDKEAISKILGRLLLKAVSERSLKSKKVAISFSGGIDSSLIAHLLSQTGVDFVGLVVGVKGEPQTEWAEKASKLLGINLRIQEIDEDNLENILKENIWRIEEDDPVKLSLAIPFYLCAKLAKNCGLTRVLTGQGADELFGGYYKFLKILDEGGVTMLDESIFNRVRNAHEDSYQVCEKAAAPERVRMIHPYADLELIEYGLSIPSSLKVSKPNDTIRKHILRKAALDINLPKQLAEVPKKAIQYSTGIDRRIEKLAKSNGMKTKQYVNLLFKDIFGNFNLEAD